nr:MAG TPA: hypothetical protein [Caudoviricetes sp.]
MDIQYKILKTDYNRLGVVRDGHSQHLYEVCHIRRYLLI